MAWIYPSVLPYGHWPRSVSLTLPHMLYFNGLYLVSWLSVFPISFLSATSVSWMSPDYSNSDTSWGAGRCPLVSHWVEHSMGPGARRDGDLLLISPQGLLSRTLSFHAPNCLVLTWVIREALLDHPTKPCLHPPSLSYYHLGIYIFLHSTYQLITNGNYPWVTGLYEYYLSPRLEYKLHEDRDLVCLVWH